eukprot:TRINITY_DN1161_c0_g2_i2.p3 TRINITY_DN1161_c0_g2~~TRINITY_DN1161_c0_g2_i2.p3  ORF type:complete len:129 (-),score=43.30 TRINITY_DN1161_c0_g2_i2:82-468(-)
MSKRKIAVLISIPRRMLMRKGPFYSLIKCEGRKDPKSKLELDSKPEVEEEVDPENKLREYLNHYVRSRKLFRHPAYKNTEFVNRHLERMPNGEYLRDMGKRIKRNAIKRDIETFCRLILFKDRKAYRI